MRSTRWILFLILFCVVAANAFLAWQLYTKAHEAQRIKLDYSKINSISYGMLSVNVWKESANEILSHKIDSFHLAGPRREIVVKQVNALLNRLLDRLQYIIKEQTSDKNLSSFFKRTLVKMLFDVEKFRKEIPGFSETIVDEMNKKENKEQLKTIVKDKMQDYVKETGSKTSIIPLLFIYERNGCVDLDSCNSSMNRMLTSLNAIVKRNAIVILCSTCLLFLLWFTVRRKEHLHKLFLSFAIVSCIILLLVGVSTPMIEIDARIGEFSFMLLGEPMHFKDQIIFFQSKSILDVVRILITDFKFQTTLVGFLILLFSVIFPFSKMGSALLLVLNPERMGRSKVARFLVYYSGKWSMADVMVVAIFMAYVAFQGILDSQLEQVETKTENLTVLTTNKTGLQPGFVIFLAYCLLSLYLSTLIKKYTERNKTLKQLKHGDETEQDG